MKNVLKLSAYLLCGMFLLNSCNSGSSTESKTDSANAMVQPAAPAPDSAAASQSKLTDPEIASIALTADQIDIDYAEIAIGKSKNNDVVQFAKTMKKDHSSVNDQAKALAQKLNLVPQDNPTTQSLQSNANKVKTDLNAKSGADFDKAYIDNEVSYHQAAIDLVENKLIPDATNSELKDLLQKALPIFKEHLKHAEKIQQDLNK